jgi:hypothetical protein
MITSFPHVNYRRGTIPTREARSAPQEGPDDDGGV